MHWRLQAQAIVIALTDCYDNVVPCFPPGYQAFDTIFAKFHEHLAFFVDCVGAAAATLSSNDILQVHTTVRFRRPLAGSSQLPWYAPQRHAGRIVARQRTKNNGISARPPSECCTCTNAGLGASSAAGWASDVQRLLCHRERFCACMQMIAWTQDFVHNCGELGLSDEQAAFSTAEGSGTALLISQYASRTYEMLHNWSVNILQVSRQCAG